MGHQAVDDAVGGVLAGLNGHFGQLKRGGTQRNVAFLLAGSDVDRFFLVADGREGDGLYWRVGSDFIFPVDVADGASQAVVDDHVDEGQWLAALPVGDCAAYHLGLGHNCLSRNDKKGEEQQSHRQLWRKRLHS